MGKEVVNIEKDVVANIADSKMWARDAPQSKTLDIERCSAANSTYPKVRALDAPRNFAFARAPAHHTIRVAFVEHPPPCSVPAI